MAYTTDILRRLTASSKSEARKSGNRRSGANANRLGFQRHTLSGQQSVQRLQIGGTGILVMLLLVGLANIVNQRAMMADERAVPEAVAPIEAETPRSEKSADPLVEAGVVPDLPDRPATEVAQEPAIVPEQAGGAGQGAPRGGSAPSASGN